MTPKVFPLFPASAAPLWVIGAIVVVLIALVGVMVAIGFSTRNVTFELNDRGLRIRGGMYGKFIPRDVLVRDRVRIININVERDYKPRWRTNGIGLPGYVEGWFRLVDGERALVFVTDPSNVVYIPTTEGYALMVSPKQPEEFVRTLTDRH